MTTYTAAILRKKTKVELLTLMKHCGYIRWTHQMRKSHCIAILLGLVSYETVVEEVSKKHRETITRYINRKKQRRIIQNALDEVTSMFDAFNLD